MNFAHPGRTRSTPASSSSCGSRTAAGGDRLRDGPRRSRSRITPEQYKAHERQRFAFQDLLAVVPGDYRALFLLKNKTAKDFSSFETRIIVPPADAGRPGSASRSSAIPASAVPEAQKTEPQGLRLRRPAVSRRRPQRVHRRPRRWAFSSRPGTSAGLARRGPPAFVLDLFSLDTNEQRRDLPAGRGRRRPRRPGDPPRLGRRAARGRQARLLPGPRSRSGRAGRTDGSSPTDG
ncbi:MAG: hypothetical protein MZU79_04025 [Anaerotruncus sp.]|nr:hypothetical protein [Anaerotruncus sp.]